MHHTEAVRHESAGRSVRCGDEFGQLLGQGQSLVVVLAGFAGVETDVLQQQDVAVGQALGAGERIGAHHISGQLDVAAQLLPQRLRDGCERELRIGAVLGSSEMGGHDDLGTRVRQRLERGHRRDDPARVGDVAVIVERNVQVGAHEYAPARNPFCQ